MTPAPVSIVDRGTFCLMDLSRVGYVISICEYDERGKVVLRPDFRGQRLNLYFRDLTDGVGIATEADIEKTCKFSAKWALAARKDPEKAPLVVHCAAGISRSTAIAMIPLIAYYESVHLAARRLYQIREFAQPNTHILYLIHQTLSLEENIYEILFQAQKSWGCLIREQEIPGGQIRGKYPGNTPRSFTIPCMKRFRLETWAAQLPMR